MTLLMLLLPLISFIIISFYGTYLGRIGVLLYAIVNISVLNLLSFLLLLIFLVDEYCIFLTCGSWLRFEFFDVKWMYSIDLLAVSMSYVITLISMFVHLYSIDYMYGDPNRSLFLGYLSLFTFFMLLLVCSGNLFLFFLSWEGVGICSYLLINFWNTRVLATQSAIKALLVNRVSDLFLLVGFAELSLYYSTSDICAMDGATSHYIPHSFIVGFFDFSTFTCLCLLLGVVGKSAQLFLHTWLPDAMEGPTPVSALLHAATMVTAGIFLILRFSFIFDTNPAILQVAGFLGASTIIVSGTIGLFQFDIKKVIAYSTCSQLGYMLVACSVSSYFVSLYHFTIHAFFKALLFLLSGGLIHAFSNEQDMRQYGGLLFAFPLSCILFIIGNSALIAEPFMSGYFSKELIIFSLNDSYIGIFNCAYWLAFYGALLTILYSCRSLWLVFLGQIRGFFNVWRGFHELSFILIYPLGLLGILSICSGYLFLPIYENGSMLGLFSVSYYHAPINHFFFDFNTMEHNILLVSCNFIISLIFVGYFYLNKLFGSIHYSFFRYIFISRWYFDFIYNRIIVLLSLRASENIFYQYLDKGFVELFGPLGLYRSANFYHSVSQSKNNTLFSDIIYILGYFIIFLLFLLCSYYTSLNYQTTGFYMLHIMVFNKTYYQNCYIFNGHINVRRYVSTSTGSKDTYALLEDYKPYISNKYRDSCYNAQNTYVYSKPRNISTYSCLFSMGFLTASFRERTFASTNFLRGVEYFIPHKVSYYDRWGWRVITTKRGFKFSRRNTTVKRIWGFTKYIRTLYMYNPLLLVLSLKSLSLYIIELASNYGGILFLNTSQYNLSMHYMMRWYARNSYNSTIGSVWQGGTLSAIGTRFLVVRACLALPYRTYSNYASAWNITFVKILVLIRILRHFFYKYECYGKIRREINKIRKIFRMFYYYRYIVSYSHLDSVVLAEPSYRRAYKMIREANNFGTPVIGSCSMSNTALWYDYWLPMDPVNPASCIFMTSFVSSASLAGVKLRVLSLFFKMGRYDKYC